MSAIIKQSYAGYFVVTRINDESKQLSPMNYRGFLLLKLIIVNYPRVIVQVDGRHNYGSWGYDPLRFELRQNSYYFRNIIYSK